MHAFFPGCRVDERTGSFLLISNCHMNLALQPACHFGGTVFFVQKQSIIQNVFSKSTYGGMARMQIALRKIIFPQNATSTIINRRSSTY
jgi:hypothetical protein